MDDSDEYAYNSYELESDSGANVQSYSKTFILPPNCVNALCMFDNSMASSPYSLKSVASSYRLKLDNKNLSQRPVVFDQPLYQDDIMKSLVNMSMRPRCYDKIPLSNVVDKRQAQDNGDVLKLISTPAPQSVGNKLLQLNVECSAVGVDTFNVYKVVQKVI
jgi:hypothetical protein